MAMNEAKKLRGLLAASLIVSLFAAAASAQQPPTVRVRGTIDKVDGHILTVKSRNGEELTVKLADNPRVLTVNRKSLADVKEGVFVGITALPEPDGTQKAVEIHIFPEAMRGTGEGYRPWDLMPHSTMTNANIASAVTRSDGKALVLKYKDGEKTFTVPAAVAVVEFAPATMADLEVGAKIFVVAGKKQPDGSIETPSLIVGHDGVNPPM
jgi:hypothetical protein